MSQLSSKVETANAVATLMYELTSAWDARLEEAVARVQRDEDADLTVRQALVVWQLHDPLKMSDLARGLGCNQSNATGLVDRLTQAGYVERADDQRDRRVRWVKLTAKGKDFRSRLSGALDVESPLEALDLADLEALQVLLERLRAVSLSEADRTDVR